MHVDKAGHERGLAEIEDATSFWDFALSECSNADDDPIFCLLEDDKLLTGFSVETGRLLDVPASADQSFAHVLINVKIRLAQDQMPIG